MALIIVMFFIWLYQNQPGQISLTIHSVIPNLFKANNWVSLTAIMASFLGMELATVHVNQIDNPKQTFPRALFGSVSIILATVIIGSLAIAYMIPQHKLSLIEGVMQAFSDFLAIYHMKWLMPLLTVMIGIGSIGGMINWVISPIKGLMHASEDHYLPEFLAKTNEHGVAKNLLLLQAILVSLVCSAFLFMPSINSSYWLLTDLSTQAYMMMYLLMFFVSLKVIHQKLHTENPLIKKNMLITQAILGVVGCLISMIVGFFPSRLDSNTR